MLRPHIIGVTLATLAAPALAQPADPADRALIERAAAVVPSERQIAWQRLEFQCFIHFGMNTFTDREWGEGNEDPKIFNPTDLDADQWAAAAQDAGMRAIVLVAKHHDGFCLWPSKFTEHSVKNSPWRGGKGDVVREASEACRRHGLKFGVYLSPADLHEPTYGKSDLYNQFFMNQLRELLTSYGPIHEVWLDGATPRDKGQVYDYHAWCELIRQLQPGAVIFNRGPDVRWVGNEAGQSRASEWSVIPLPAPVEEYQWRDMTGADLGSLSKLRGAAALHWFPAETDTSIRPGWFWHENENDKVRSLDDLLNVYFGAVGGNSVLLLNVPPDRRGRFHEKDVVRLKELGLALRLTFKEGLPPGGIAAVATASTEGHPAGAAADGNPDTFWTVPDWTPEPTITFTLPEMDSFDCILLQEHIASGQRVEKFVVEAFVTPPGSTIFEWREIASGTTIGYKKLIHTGPVVTESVRVRFLESRVRPTLAEFGLFDFTTPGHLR